jgi:hypothetical protein
MPESPRPKKKYTVDIRDNWNGEHIYGLEVELDVTITDETAREIAWNVISAATDKLRYRRNNCTHNFVTCQCLHHANLRATRP